MWTTHHLAPEAVVEINRFEDNEPEVLMAEPVGVSQLKDQKTRRARGVLRGTKPTPKLEIIQKHSELHLCL